MKTKKVNAFVLLLLMLVYFSGCLLEKSTGPKPSSNRTTYNNNPAPVSMDASLAGGYGGSYAGITVGGSQDIGYFRNLVENGSVPDTNVLTPEGLFSEHDFPIEVDPTNKLLSVTPAVAVGQIPGDTIERVLVQIVMSSNIDASTFKHQKTKMVFVVDRSGSMGGTAGSDGKTKMTLIKDMLGELVDSLRSEDYVGIVSFTSSYTVDAPLMNVGTGKDSLMGVIGGLVQGGSTNIESALRKGFEMLAAAPDEGYQKRVLLFTDARPNTGLTGENDFLTLTSKYADSGIGMTAFGVGLDFGVDLAKSISEVKGGNYVFLNNSEAITKFVSEDMEFTLSPVAYDFELKVTSGSNYSLVNVYGMPGGSSNEFSISAATLFLSKNKGTIVCEFSGKGGGTIGNIQMSYVEASTGKTVTLPAEINTSLLTQEDDGLTYSHPGVKKAAVLTGMVICINRSISSYLVSDFSNAIAILDTLILALDNVATELADPTLVAEKDLVIKLRENMAINSAPIVSGCIDTASIKYDVSCTMEYDPVCGCDGRTYGNACVANISGITSSTPGACLQGTD